MSGRVASGEITTDRPRQQLTHVEHCDAAFLKAMAVWKQSPELDEEGRVVAALIAYQSKLDELVIRAAVKGSKRFGDHVAGGDSSTVRDW